MQASARTIPIADPAYHSGAGSAINQVLDFHLAASAALILA